MHGILLDLKSAVRQLRRSPGTTAAAILTLAIGIGTTTAVFSFLAAVMSAGSPVSDMDRRVALWSHNRSEAETKNSVSEGDFLEWRRRATLLDNIVATRRRAANLGGMENPVRVTVQEVTPDYFDFFRWSPAAGRGLTFADARPGAPTAIVVSHEFWRNSLAFRPDIVGASVRIDGSPATIVGVLPRMPAVGGIYVPLVLDSAHVDHTTRNLVVFAHLREGVAIEQARAEMESIGETLGRELPASNRGWSVNTRPLQEEFIGPQARLAFAILAGTVFSVLLIGCVNIANLLLAQGLARRGELAIRVAIGAGRWRLARQLLVESGVLAMGGALASLLVSRWTLQLLLAMFGTIDSPWIDQNGLNARALAAAAALAMLATVVSGVAPIAASSKADLVNGLHAAGRSGARVNRGLTGSLVAAEIGLAVLLLIVSGLLLRTLAAIEGLDPGFDVRNVLTASVTLPQRTADEEAVRWFARAVARARAMPGVVTAGATSRVPFAGSRFNPNRGLEIEGRVASADDGTWAVDYVVTPGFVETLRVPIIAGRTFTEIDGERAPRVAVVSQAMAKRYWPNQSPLGARLRQGDEPPGEWRTVVGVIGDIRNDDADQPPIPYLYVPLAQRPARTMTLALRTSRDAAALAPSLRRAIAELDPDQPLYNVHTMADVLEEDLEQSRNLIQVLAALAAVALALAAIGVWGVAVQSIGQRTREIGLRVALGASGRQVLGLIAVQALAPQVVGLVLGLLAGLGVAQVMRSVLFQVTPTDATTLAASLALLAAVATIATIGPALRATRIDPVVALRTE